MLRHSFLAPPCLGPKPGFPPTAEGATVCFAAGMVDAGHPLLRWCFGPWGAFVLGYVRVTCGHGDFEGSSSRSSTKCTKETNTKEMRALYSTLDFRKFTSQKWAQPRGALSCWRALGCQHKQWFRDSNPSLSTSADWICESWPQSASRGQTQQSGSWPIYKLYMYTIIYIHIQIHMQHAYTDTYTLDLGRRLSIYWLGDPAPWIGSRVDTVGNPHRIEISQFELFGLNPLIEIRRAAPCRAIRGNSISVNSTSPPLFMTDVWGPGELPRQILYAITYYDVYYNMSYTIIWHDISWYFTEHLWECRTVSRTRPGFNLHGCLDGKCNHVLTSLIDLNGAEFNVDMGRTAELHMQESVGPRILPDLKGSNSLRQHIWP